MLRSVTHIRNVFSYTKMYVEVDYINCILIHPVHKNYFAISNCVFKFGDSTQVIE